MKPIKALLTTSLLIASAISLTACSSGPSDSDAKQAIASTLADCQYLSVSKFEKVNGIAQGERNYQVDVKYTIDLTPTPDIKRFASETYPAYFQALKTKVTHAKEVRSAWDTDQDAWVKANPGSLASDFEVAYPDRWKAYQAVIGDVLTGDQQLESAPINAKHQMAANLVQACPGLNAALVRELFSGVEPVERYAEDVGIAFTGTIPMVKTDNGWQAAR
ncbi:hypothetical protein [Jeongeupia sp. USM3]|uniref:hypothetical protein n=1 Tax=Jeongeupia sp. USM3 TaxID=1906741 RepID=UPI00089DFBA7|nr:hypothetical protein [Jeongeupia sp. USM3]AOX99676.1 hypothetical protein BJP62_03920 [Jeongeupia sp. USM3]